ncbi:MAG: hypothetical protein Q9160_001291 [Pyrenula sp. 1 TL-2023]
MFSGIPRLIPLTCIREHDKAGRYIDLLDAARCKGSWNDIPELIRKVNKHAPGHQCLVQTANADQQVATYLASHLDHRPTSTTSTSPNSLSELIPPLLSTIEEKSAPPQNIFEAQVCLGWIHCALSEPGLAASRLPGAFNAVVRDFSGQGKATNGWTEVCIVKGACLKGTSQALSGSPSQGLITFQSIYQWIAQRESSPSPNPQLAFWLKQYLAQLAVIASRNIQEDAPNASEQIELTLQAFRLWANHVRQKPDLAKSDTYNGPGLLKTEAVWNSYYGFLSKVLRDGRDYPATGQIPSRLQQYTELKRVETIHENNVLRTTQFPKANESNRRIEGWVEEAFQNWVILSGPGWHDEDLGEGGRNAVSRNMLDVLYRAATKSFHSTLILRRLFQVHKALTDFDLAYKAFDTYLEIILNAKARIKKSGEPLSGLDSNDTLFCTVAEGIEGLCCFGAFKEARKANDLSLQLSEWLSEPSLQSKSGEQINGNAVDKHTNETSHKNNLSPRTLALAYRAIGIGKASWAYWTPINEDRASIQVGAITDLKEALQNNSGTASSLNASFALGLLLAETRDLNESIDVLREALSRPFTESSDIPDLPGHSSKFQHYRQRIPLWHLLGLVLSARQEHDAASRSCAAAFEQFPHGKILFGHRNRDNALKTNGTPEKLDLHTQASNAKQGLVDEMDGRELEQILEIRVTELALTELTEGAEVAINTCNELLSLFARLFGNLDLEPEGDVKDKTEPGAPKSSSGTARSVRGSIFGRKRQTIPGLRNSSATDSITPSIPEDSAPSWRSTGLRPDNPAIEIQSDDPTVKLESPVSFGPLNTADQTVSKPTNKLHRREGSINKIIRQHSEHKTHRPPSSRISSTRQSFETSHEEPFLQNEVGVAVSSDIPPPISPTANHDSSPTAKQSLPPVAHNMPPNAQPPPPGQHVQPPEQDVRLPSISPHTSHTHPPPRFPLAQAQIHALALLTKTWLVISNLYRRASLFDDAREAVDEAANQAHRIETLTATLYGSSSTSFFERKWGGGKSSDELFAEVFATRGHLSVARGEPHAAMEMYEIALGYFQDSSSAIIGLSGLLLDIYEQKIPPERPKPDLTQGMEELANGLDVQNGNKGPTAAIVESVWTSSRPGTARSESQTIKTRQPSTETDESLRKTPANLNRIAARDRAYGLLSTLTKLGSGWDDSEAWFSLARAHELGGEIDKAKEVLWWCVELEDTRPIRHFQAVKGRGGYVL